MSAAQAELAQARSLVDDPDGLDVDDIVAALDNFRHLVDGVDDLVDLADEAIDAARRADR
jgi:hypothetical protein